MHSDLMILGDSGKKNQTQPSVFAISGFYYSLFILDFLTFQVLIRNMLFYSQMIVVLSNR